MNDLRVNGTYGKQNNKKNIQAKILNQSVTHQSGAILVVALIMLVIITIIGLSTIESTSLEVQMAANAQFKNIVFQESEHAIEDSAADIPLLGRAYTESQISTTPDWPTKDVSTASSANGHVSSTSEVQFAGFALPQGEKAGSIRIGGSGYSLYNYEIHGTASVENTGASNTNVRGAYILGVRPE